jgi:hypothetical protein
VAVSTQLIQSRIDQLTALITAYEAALLALATNGLQKSYEFNDGQQEIRVTRQDIGQINSLLDSLYNQLTVMCNRIGQGLPAVTARGTW